MNKTAIIDAVELVSTKDSTINNKIKLGINVHTISKKVPCDTSKLYHFFNLITLLI